MNKLAALCYVFPGYIHACMWFVSGHVPAQVSDASTGNVIGYKWVRPTFPGRGSA